MRGLLRCAGPLQAWTDLADKTTSQFPTSNDCEVTGRPPFSGYGEFVISRPPNRQKVEMSDGSTRPDHSNSFRIPYDEKNRSPQCSRDRSRGPGGQWPALLTTIRPNRARHRWWCKLPVREPDAHPRRSSRPGFPSWLFPERQGGDRAAVQYQFVACQWWRGHDVWV